MRVLRTLLIWFNLILTLGAWPDSQWIFNSKIILDFNKPKSRHNLQEFPPVNCVPKHIRYKTCFCFFKHVSGSSPFEHVTLFCLYESNELKEIYWPSPLARRLMLSKVGPHVLELGKRVYLGGDRCYHHVFMGVMCWNYFMTNSSRAQWLWASSWSRPEKVWLPSLVPSWLVNLNQHLFSLTISGNVFYCLRDCPEVLGGQTQCLITKKWFECATRL